MKRRAAAQWSRLDNAAKIFPPITSKTDPKVFRFSCELCEEIEPEVLQEALDRALDAFPQFRAVLRRGLFWYYLEGSPLPAAVHPENTPPCAPLYDPVRKTLLFSVTYYGRRINFEVYHALTDGTGALHFLRTLVYQYLIVRHADAFPDGPPAFDYDASRGERGGDSFRKYYTSKGRQEREAAPAAYRLTGARLSENRIRVLEGELSASVLLEKTRAANTTVTAFLAAALLLAIYAEMPVRARKRPVVISVPVNLRKYFASETARNFFGVVKLTHQFPGDGETFEEAAAAVAAGLARELTAERISARMNRLSALEHNALARIIPLFLKDWSLHIAGKKTRRAETCSLSNLGKVEMPGELAQYIRLFSVFNSADSLKLCMCTFGDRMVITLTTPFIDTEIPKRFFRTLTGFGIPLVLRANRPDDEEEEDSHAVL